MRCWLKPRPGQLCPTPGEECPSSCRPTFHGGLGLVGGRWLTGAQGPGDSEEGGSLTCRRRTGPVPARMGSRQRLRRRQQARGPHAQIPGRPWSRSCSVADQEPRVTPSGTPPSSSPSPRPLAPSCFAGVPRLSLVPRQRRGIKTGGVGGIGNCCRGTGERRVSLEEGRVGAKGHQKRRG